MEKIRRSCGFYFGIDVDSIGSRGGLCLAWRGNAKIALQSFSNRHIDVIIEEEGEGVKWRFTGFYGSPYSYDREHSWNLLRQLKNQGDDPWLVCGDFNEILYSFEKKGGLPRKERRMEAFRKALEDCRLVDLGFSGRRFTWERGNLPETNIQKRLDRGVATERWSDLFLNFLIQHLPHSFSDHCPLLIDTDHNVRRIADQRFRFEAWWILEETFLDVTTSIWENSTGDLMQKLGNLKRGLQRWSVQLQQNKRMTKEVLLSKLETLLDADRSEENLAEIIDTKIHLNLEIEKDESYWEQRARINWLKMGDRNTNNVKLNARFTKEEIREALLGMGPTKAPGEDGFPALFFQKCWPIVGDDISNFCFQRLNEGMDFHSINKTNIVLIPKIQNPSSVTHFRPISLCNVIYKLIAKAIANRLKGIIHKCIDLAQSAFVPGRLISDNVLLAYEILHTLKRKRLGKKGFMAVKLDMSKAFDRVEWGFVRGVMGKMGFDPRLINLVLNCVSSVSYSVCFNENMGKTFLPSRGLRQGDPLSPFLFLICGEGLSSLMRLAQEENILKGVKASRRGPAISHLLFADDCILFVEATDRGSYSLKQTLQEYETSSGQRVNFEKSSVFFNSNTKENERRAVSQILGVRRANDFERYLGLPSMVGKRKRISFQNLKDRLKQKIDSWSIRYLSQGGKEVFIKAVLQAIPTYSMACFLLPKTLCSDLDRIIANFWWQKRSNKRGIHWCAWKDICLLKEDGGLGYRDFAKFNVALLAKQGWRLINYPNSLLTRVLKAKYFPNSDFFKAQLGNLPSFTWKSIWAARGLLDNGRCWRVGRGDQISIWGDSWIPGIPTDRITIQANNVNVELVSDLIEPTSRSWKTELIRNTFQPVVAEQILKIPLAETDQEDLQVWGREPTGEFSVRSAYKLLHGTNLDPTDLSLQTKTKTFYNKLWKLHIPTKIKMTIWRISWDYIPSFVNLKIRKVVLNTLCPRCGCFEENSWHIFIECPRSMEVWDQLNLSWVLNQNINNIWGWLTWVFDRGSEEQLHFFCCCLWFIWFSRNHLIYEKRLMSGSEIAKKISAYTTELAISKVRTLTFHSSGNLQQLYKRGWTSIHFDAAYDRLGFRSASGIIARNENKEIIASQAVTHSNIADPFTAEAYAGLQAIKLGIIIGAIITDIQSLKKGFQEIEFIFVPKEQNFYAHTIAKESLRSGEGFYLEKEIPEAVRRTIENPWPYPPD
ncbi:uncharacterized protein [Gossypium hirsutum]|uniref:Reverse transcriptase domain-containing protein n=1 Tax=Gossypium hirsutum TaxID=3635 RepID=A0ABM3AN64_GOSHI|nr:uncharacterized protein LOC107892503 [Gossypium hirsutum]